ncbi:RNA polymerase sigma factor [Halothiobacillus sp. DCM-1]|uniref:RNA polymerase sigma factor n=1 Tax=Halothiobacillus sp. DCM-1 TaxID=3112558 RepID=UPI00324BD9D7
MSITELFFGRLAFNRQLQNLRPRLYRLACAWCKDPYLADDLVQEAMILATRRQGQLRAPELLDRWVIRILANRWFDHLRQLHPTENLDEVMDWMPMDERDEPDQAHRRSETIERVRAAVARLPPLQRVVVTLVDLEELSYKEVAEVLDLPMGTVMSRLARGREKLKQWLIDEADEGRRASSCRLRRVQ